MDDSTLLWYEAILNMEEECLKMLVDLYNKGVINPKAKLALEAIESFHDTL